MKKTIVVASVAALIATTGVAGMASAATQHSTVANPMSGLVTAMAKKFSLKESDVQSVVDANHTAMEAQRETRVKDQVTQLVKDGKLTQAQADLINTKRKELQKTRDAHRASMSSKTDTERKADMGADRTALDAWFADSGIPTEYRYLVFSSNHGHGDRGGPRGDMKRDAMTPKSSETSR